MSVFPEDERGRAIGTWTAWTGVATVIGPLAGGVLLGVGSWRWVFGVSLIPVAATLFLIPRALPAGARPAVERGPLDFLGAVLCALGLAGLVFGLIQQPTKGWGDPQVAGSLPRGRRHAAGVRLARAPQQLTDGAALDVPREELRGRQRGDVLHLRGPRRRHLPDRPLPAADRRLVGARGRPRAVAGHGAHVLAVGRFGALADRIGPRPPDGEPGPSSPARVCCSC